MSIKWDKPVRVPFSGTTGATNGTDSVDIALPPLVENELIRLNELVVWNEDASPLECFIQKRILGEPTINDVLGGYAQGGAGFRWEGSALILYNQQTFRVGINTDVSLTWGGYLIYQKGRFMS